mmetsp:Transcript_31152/g.87337  ORF Transcript_31152/g.87337 Transcript_31152/m.87337 type:complete len:206 (-) Transcript_31152:230-847(-)
MRLSRWPSSLYSIFRRPHSVLLKSWELKSPRRSPSAASQVSNSGRSGTWLSLAYAQMMWAMLKEEYMPIFTVMTSSDMSSSSQEGWWPRCAKDQKMLACACGVACDRCSMVAASKASRKASPGWYPSEAYAQMMLLRFWVLKWGSALRASSVSSPNVSACGSYPSLAQAHMMLANWRARQRPRLRKTARSMRPMSSSEGRRFRVA